MNKFISIEGSHDLLFQQFLKSFVSSVAAVHFLCIIAWIRWVDEHTNILELTVNDYFYMGNKEVNFNLNSSFIHSLTDCFSG